MSFFFFFNDTATTEIYTLSLHDALPISRTCSTTSIVAASVTRMPRTKREETPCALSAASICGPPPCTITGRMPTYLRSEEHTSELQSQSNLVCRLLLEKKKKAINHILSV